MWLEYSLTEYWVLSTLKNRRLASLYNLSMWKYKQSEFSVSGLSFLEISWLSPPLWPGFCFPNLLTGDYCSLMPRDSLHIQAYFSEDSYHFPSKSLSAKPSFACAAILVLLICLRSSVALSDEDSDQPRQAGECRAKNDSCTWHSQSVHSYPQFSRVFLKKATAEPCSLDMREAWRVSCSLLPLKKPLK